MNRCPIWGGAFSEAKVRLWVDPGGSPIAQNRPFKTRSRQPHSHRPKKLIQMITYCCVGAAVLCEWRYMPRFYLNLFNDQDLRDEEGAEMPDLGAAKVKAIASVRALMAEHVTLGRPIYLSHRIEITDEYDKVLATIPFGEAVTIVDR